MLLVFVCMCLVRTVATSSTDSGCDKYPIGLQYRSKIPDSRFTASSYYNQGTGDTRYKPSNARLHGTYGWGPRTTHNLQDYLQVDLLKERMICGVATQGHGFNNEWVTQYKLHLSLNGTDWNTYKENGTEKVFEGNTDRSIVVRRYFQNVQSARYIRLIPTKYYQYKAMRVEVYSDPAPTCPPKIISATAVSSTIIRVMWDPPPDNECRNGKLKGYFVSWFNTLLGGNTPENFKIENPSATVYIITGLEKYSEYMIKLRAYNQFDKTSPPDVITTKTSEDAPSCSPTISSVHPMSSTSIRVNWTPLPNTTCRNGLVRGYKMAYRKSDEDKLYYINISNPNVTTNVVGGLRKYTNYSFQVLAYTIKDGNLSEVSFGITKEDVPECSPVITNIQAASSTSIRVAWKQDLTCLNGIPRGNIIVYSLLGNNTVQYINITDPLSTSMTVTGLRKYSKYSFRILAYTIGEGPLGKASIKRTAEDAPSCSPKLVSSQTISSTSVRLTWTPPPDNGCRNGILRGYRIGYSSSERGIPQTVSVDNPNATTHDVIGLQKYTWYNFLVLAFTIHSGPWSNRLRKRTCEDAPVCSPTLVSVRNISSTCISVTWTSLPSKCSNGIIRGFKIFYNDTKTGEGFLKKINDSVTTTVNITGLSKYTEYSFKILAYTVKDSPLSNQMTRRTSEDAPDCSPTIRSLKTLSSTIIRVTWNRLPSSRCTNGIVRGYKVKYKRSREMIYQEFQVGNGDATSADIKALKKFAGYTFRVLAYTVEDGKSSEESRQIMTKADAPSVPTKVNCTLIPANGSIGPRVEITWDLPQERNGNIVKYTIIYLYNKDKSTEKKVVILQSKIGRRIREYTVNAMGEAVFSFKINAYTIKEGPYQNGEDLAIPAYPPNMAPTHISTQKLNDTAFVLQWRPIPRNMSNGIVNKYDVRWIVSQRGQRTSRVKRLIDRIPKNASTKEPTHTINGLSLCAQYSISVRAATIAGPGPYSQPVKIRTSQPDNPYSLLVKQTSITSALLTWRKPTNVIEQIQEYLIDYTGYKTYMNNYKVQGNASSKNGSTNHLIENLVPATQYEFWVSAFTECGWSSRSNSTKTITPITNPLEPNVISIQQYHDTGVAVNVTLFPSVQTNGPIGAYQVIVQLIRKSVSFDSLPSNFEHNLHDYLLATKNKLDYYITAEVTANWLKSSKELIIGENTTHKEYRNVPLKKGSRYHIYERAVTDDNGTLLYSKVVLIGNISVADEVVEETFSRIQDSSGSGGLIGGLIGIALFLILVIIVGAILWRRKRNIKKKEIQSNSLTLVVNSPVQQKNTDTSQEKEDFKPIYVTDFPEYIATMRKDDFHELRNQYKSVQSSQLYPCIVAKKPANKVKNRYGNIVTYDHSRVLLQSVDGNEDSQYINASFMHNYDGSQKTYIASQGPLPETIIDFWRMIWEQKTSSIVMLTNLIELGKRKCHQYWPDETEKYADITVETHKTEIFADYVIRTLLLSKSTPEKRSRTVLHFHFTAWPDKGVPLNATAVLSFRRKVREMSKWNTGPTVVHCSAGVGRTGAYMIIDAMLEQIKNNDTINVVNYLTILRKDRPYMVQTSDQYVFIHLALFEEITSGNTEIQVNNLNTIMKKLSAIEDHDNQNLSGYAREFQRLEFVALYGIPEEYDVGQGEENINKNRYHDIVAINRCRVILSTDDSNQGDYINATFIDTYREKNAFILTQAPMENTIADFWRMIIDYEIGTIVMLNNLEEGDEMFPVYWPEEETVVHNGIQVELLKTEESDNVILQQLQVTYQSACCSVQHIQYTAWENNSVPKDIQSVLNLLEMVRKSQQKCDNNPIVLHCSNGVGRSGTFCAIASTLERVKQEQVLDVFQTVKSIRVNRRGAVETLSQYEFCYTIVKEYLDLFSDYANFQDN